MLTTTNAGADINTTNNNGFTPLMVAAYYGHVPSTQLLINKGVDINQKNNEGETALHVAIRKGQTEIIEPLVKAGADINIKKNNGFTPLMVAAYYGDVPSAQLLITKGANVNALDPDTTAKEARCNSKAGQGWTALSRAVYQSQPEMVKLLLNNGAEIIKIDDCSDNLGAVAIMSDKASNESDKVAIALLNKDIHQFDGALTILNNKSDIFSTQTFLIKMKWTKEADGGKATLEKDKAEFIKEFNQVNHIINLYQQQSPQHKQKFEQYLDTVNQNSYGKETNRQLWQETQQQYQKLSSTS